MKKRTFFLCIIVGIFIFVMSASACAETGGTCGDNLAWTLDEEGTLTISGTGAMNDYVLGSAPWFQYRNDITTLTIDGDVTNIGDYAFGLCSGLTSVTIPGSVKGIGEYSFGSCFGLTSVTIEEGVASIGDSAFTGCNGLTSLTIPSSVTSIERSAFEYCTGLTEIAVSEGNTNYKSIDGVLFNKAATELVAYPEGLSGSYTIPSSVKNIGDSAFYNCAKLTSVTIPGSVTGIGDRAFQYCTGLTSVTIPGSVTSIGDEAFSYCYGLTSVTIPNSVTSIENSAFLGCTDLTDIAVCEENTNFSSIDGVLFNKTATELILCPQGRRAESYSIPKGVTNIGDYAFSGCTALTNVTIPDSVISIGNSAFQNCTGLTSVTIPASVTSIGNSAFLFCHNLKTIVFCGEAPEFSNLALERLECDCLYPDGDGSWETIVSGNEQFGGRVTWAKYGDSFIEGNILTPQYFPDSNLLSRLKTMFGGYLSATSASKVYELNISNSGIRNLAGIEVFKNLSRLDCSMNSISNLNTDAFTYLWRLNCSHNNLTSLNVINNAELNTLDCSNNNISSLSVYEPDNIYRRMSLNCSNNSLSSLPAIDYSELICFGNHLSRLDLSSGMYLRRFECSPQILYLNDIYSGVQMADVVGMNDLGRVSAGNGCTYDPATGILTAEGSANGINYCYDVDGNGVLMSVYLSCLQIKKQPKSVTANAGDTVVLEFEAEGNVSYKWECRYLNWDWEPAWDFNTGYTSSTLELREVTPELNNYRFKCIAFNENGESVVSDVVSVSVTQEYSLTFMSGDHGSLSGYAFYDGQSHTEKIRAGEKVTFSALADDGYLPGKPTVTATDGSTVEVYYDGTNLAYYNGRFYNNVNRHVYSFIMPYSDVTVSETFSASETCRSIVVDPNIQHGLIIPHKDLSVNLETGMRIVSSKQEPGTLVYLTTYPDAGYIFDSNTCRISVTGVSGKDYSSSLMTESGGQIAFQMPDEDVTVSVSFVEAPSSGKCGENIFWRLENGVLSLTGSGEMTDTATARNAWKAKKEEITSIVIGEGITGIGHDSFALLDKVDSVSLPSTLKTIEYYSFCGCTALSSIALPEGLESIGATAFFNTGLTSAVIPKSVIEIGYGAFDNQNLPEITVDPENSAYCDVDGILFTKDRKTLLQYPAAKPGAFYEVPEEVERIEYLAFGAPQYLRTLFIHDSIKSISTGQSLFSTTIRQIDFEGTEEEWNSSYHSSIAAFSDITVNYNCHRETMNDFSVSIPEAMSGKVTISAPSGGWVIGENTFSASADKPCVLAVSYDGGETYTRLTATANGDGTYSFDVNITDENTVIACAYEGDANGDGELSSGDVSRLNAGILHKADMSPLNALACDVNGDGNLSSGDISRLNAAILNKVKLSW